MLRPLIFIIIMLVENSYAFSCREFRKDFQKLEQRLGKTCEANKNILLTFDDGPVLGRNGEKGKTQKVLDALRNEQVPSTFFISTHRLEKDNSTDLNKKKDLLARMYREGHAVASHTHEHKAHDFRCTSAGCGYELTASESRRQIERSVSLLRRFSDGNFDKQKHLLVRFPYGRGAITNSKEMNMMIQSGRRIEGSTFAEQLAYYREHGQALSRASESNLSHMGWNHDARDATSDYNPISNIRNRSRYIEDNLYNLCRNRAKNIITLFHDVKEINSLESKYGHGQTVIQEMIAKSKCLGFTFVDQDTLLAQGLSKQLYIPAKSALKQAKEFIRESQRETPFDLTSRISSLANKCQDEVATSLQAIKTTLKRKKSCYSNSLKRIVLHCEEINGQTLYCIDGHWISSKWGSNEVCSGRRSSKAVLRSLKAIK